MSVKRPNRLSRVSLLTNSFTTFSRFRLSICSLWNFRSARELNLAGNIVDRSQVFRFLANENVLSAVALVAELTATSLMMFITLGIKIKSSLGRFCICFLSSSKHIQFSFWHITLNIRSSTTSWSTSRSPLYTHLTYSISFTMLLLDKDLSSSDSKFS